MEQEIDSKELYKGFDHIYKKVDQKMNLWWLTAQKNDFSVMWPNLQETADLVTFTEKILNGKLHFCTVTLMNCD